MGREKAFLEVAGLPMIEHVIRSVRSVAGRIIVVSNSPSNTFSRHDVDVVPDVRDRRGSLIGLYSGLLHSQDDYNLVVACDMPFLNRRLLEYMAGLSREYDVLLPRIGTFVEPLHAIYSRDLLPVIEECVRRDQQRIRDIFAGRRVQYLTEEEIDRFDPRRRSFVNVNTPEEYEEVTCSDWECRN